MRPIPPKQKEIDFVLYRDITTGVVGSRRISFINIKAISNRLWQKIKVVLLVFYWQFSQAHSASFTLENGKRLCYFYHLFLFRMLT